MTLNDKIDISTVDFEIKVTAYSLAISLVIFVIMIGINRSGYLTFHDKCLNAPFVVITFLVIAFSITLASLTLAKRNLIGIVRDENPKSCE